MVIFWWINTDLDKWNTMWVIRTSKELRVQLNGLSHPVKSDRKRVWYVGNVIGFICRRYLLFFNNLMKNKEFPLTLFYVSWWFIMFHYKVGSSLPTYYVHRPNNNGIYFQNLFNTYNCFLGFYHARLMIALAKRWFT